MLRWKVLLEEYGPINKCVKYPGNDAENSLSSIPLINSDVTYGNIKRETLAGIYCVDKLDYEMLPLKYVMINKYQEYKELVDKIKQLNYQNKCFCEGGKLTHLICRNEKCYSK